ncbi:MAG: hypothetical protein M1834_006279 [Cirrosporium novae-zelandiae]|nr:MAG: hypothetical protein M1834_006279 [Cirrosporium novae-zelandiae]
MSKYFPYQSQSLDTPRSPSQSSGLSVIEPCTFEDFQGEQSSIVSDSTEPKTRTHDMVSTEASSPLSETLGTNPSAPRDELQDPSSLTVSPKTPSPISQNTPSISPKRGRPASASTPRKSTIRFMKSPYFPTEPKKRSEPVSCLPFPPLSASFFGLVQEKLADQPFKLLMATIFLTKTKGEQALPVLYSVLERYPTVKDLASADPIELTNMIRSLGLQNARSLKCISLAKTWLLYPPEKGKRYRRLHYPKKENGKDIPKGEIVPDDDPRVAWEIAHLPGIGPYAIDSWRIFCRDKLRGLNEDEIDFKGEWRVVLPSDKELRAYLTWKWLKEGYLWNKCTGEIKKAQKADIIRASKGGIAVESLDQIQLLTMSEINPEDRILPVHGDDQS